jgi:hypothetical protein
MQPRFRPYGWVNRWTTFFLTDQNESDRSFSLVLSKERKFMSILPCSRQSSIRFHFSYVDCRKNRFDEAFALLVREIETIRKDKMARQIVSNCNETPMKFIDPTLSSNPIAIDRSLPITGKNRVLPTSKSLPLSLVTLDENTIRKWSTSHVQSWLIERNLSK